MLRRGESGRDEPGQGEVALGTLRHLADSEKGGRKVGGREVIDRIG